LHAPCLLLLVLPPLLALGSARGAAMRKDTGPFRVHDRVLVAYTDKYYEAKVRQRQLLASIPLQESNCFARHEYQHTVLYVQILFAPRVTSCEMQCTSAPGQGQGLGLQVTKAEKRADGWYYMLHYTVRRRTAAPAPPLVASTEAPARRPSSCRLVRHTVGGAGAGSAGS